MMDLNGDKSKIFLVICFLILTFSSNDAFADAGIFAGAANRSLSGAIALESGFGPELGFVLPFSSYLELNACLVLPRKYDVKDPQGQIFSDSDYYRLYSSMQYLSYSGGITLYGRFRQEQQWLPCIAFDMGKAVVFGSGKDGFSGLSIGWEAGVCYEFNAKWRFELIYSRLTASLSKMKLDGQISSLENEVSVTCNSLRFSAVYWLSLF